MDTTKKRFSKREMDLFLDADIIIHDSIQMVMDSIELEERSDALLGTISGQEPAPTLTPGEAEARKLGSRKLPQLDLTQVVLMDSVVTEIERVYGKEKADSALVEMTHEEVDVEDIQKSYLTEEVVRTHPKPLDSTKVKVDEALIEQQIDEEIKIQDSLAAEVSAQEVANETKKKVDTQDEKEGAPVETKRELAKAKTVDESTVRGLFDDLLFGFDANSLNEENKDQLKRLKSWMEEHPQAVLQLDGHADSTGTEAVNRIVSQKRAEMVHNYLADQGLDPMRVKFDFFGEDKPKVPNSSVENRRLNRRVELAAVEYARYAYIHFGFDSDEITPEAVSQLEKVFQFLKDNADKNIQLSGFADKAGNQAYNRELSKRRVNAASAFLQSKGIELSRITTDYFGEDKPAVPDSFPNSDALNRRVEIKIP